MKSHTLLGTRNIVSYVQGIYSQGESIGEGGSGGDARKEGTLAMVDWIL